MATLNLGRIKPVFRGAYSGSTAYVVDDIVTSAGSSYICIQAHGAGTQAVNQTAYWTQMAAGGTDVGTTITTQGDILYRDGSGLQRLAKGTAGQALKMNTAANAPEWGTIDDTFGSKLFHCTEGTFATNTTNSWTKLGLTTVRTNEVTGASLGSGVMTLPAGTYISLSFAMFYRVNGYNARLRNTTDGADLIMGGGGHSWSSPNDASSCPSFMYGKFTLSAQKNVELQYYIETSNNQTTVQSGHPNQVMLWKVA